MWINARSIINTGRPALVNRDPEGSASQEKSGQSSDVKTLVVRSSEDMDAIDTKYILMLDGFGLVSGINLDYVVVSALFSL